MIALLKGGRPTFSNANVDSADEAGDFGETDQADVKLVASVVWQEGAGQPASDTGLPRSSAHRAPAPSDPVSSILVLSSERDRDELSRILGPGHAVLHGSLGACRA